MTALALAGAGGGAVLPDLVLPAGFDRVGEVHRFEQDSGPEADRAGRVPGSPIVSSNGAPAAAGQKPALSDATLGLPPLPPPEPDPEPANDVLPTLAFIRSRHGQRVLPNKRLRREERRAGRLVIYPDVERPQIRGDCEGSARPCPFVSCRWHLYLDVDPASGALQFNFPDKELWELSETCALDVADAGGTTIERTGELVNLTRQRISQIEIRALERARRRNLHLEV